MNQFDARAEPNPLAADALASLNFPKDYIFIEFSRPVSEGSGKRYQRTEHVSGISYAKFMHLLPELLEYRLNYLQQKEGADLQNWPEVKDSIVPKLTKFFKSEFNFKDSTILDSASLAGMLYRLSEWGDLELERNGFPQAGKSGAPINKAYRRIFTGKAEGERNFPHWFIHDFFNKYLLEEYFFKPAPTQIEIQKEEEYRLRLDFNVIAQSFLNVCDSSQLKPELSKLLLHNILNLITNYDNIESNRVVSFVNKIEQLFGEDNNFESGLKQAVSLFLGQLEDHFPDFYINKIDQEKYRIALIKPEKSQRIKNNKQKPVIRQIVAVENFYCQPLKEDQASLEDYQSLPVEGQILGRDGRTWKNISLFDCCGNKVWWGDLSKQDIAKLSGPLYLLNETDSYHCIPDWVVMLKRPARDPKRPKINISSALGIKFKDDSVRVRLDYVRLKARGMIKNGKFVENPAVF